MSNAAAFGVCGRLFHLQRCRNRPNAATEAVSHYDADCVFPRRQVECTSIVEALLSESRQLVRGCMNVDSAAHRLTDRLSLRRLRNGDHVQYDMVIVSHVDKPQIRPDHHDVAHLRLSRLLTYCD